MPGLFPSGRFVGAGDNVVAQAIPRQAQAVDRRHHRVRVKGRILVLLLPVAHREFQRSRRAHGEIGPAAIAERQVLAPVRRIRLRVVLLDEAARPPHQIQSHQFPPVIRVRALLERRQRARRALPAAQLQLAVLPNEPLRPYPQVFLLRHKETQLIGEVEVRLVVGCCGKQDHPALVACQVVLYHPVALALAIPEIMALVDDHQAEPLDVFRQLLNNPRHRQHPRPHPILIPIVFPHADQVLRADDQRLDAVVILEDAGQGARHQCLAQPDHVADQHAIPLVQVMRGDLHRRLLELKQPIPKILGNLKLRETGARFLGQVVRHLEIDVIGRHRLLARPARLDDLDQFLRDVNAPPVIPTIFEPLRQLRAGVMIQNVDIQLALFGQAGECQVAAPEVACRRIHRVGAEKEIEFRVQRVPQEQFHHDFLGLQLLRQPPQAGFIRISRGANAKLFPELFGEPLLQTDGRLIIELVGLRRQTQGRVQLVRRPALHADKQPTAMPGPPGPLLDVIPKLLPTAQVEVPHAEVRPLTKRQRVLQRRRQMSLDIVEYPRHSAPPNQSH